MNVADSSALKLTYLHNDITQLVSISTVHLESYSERLGYTAVSQVLSLCGVRRDIPTCALHRIAQPRLYCPLEETLMLALLWLLLMGDAPMLERHLLSPVKFQNENIPDTLTDGPSCMETDGKHLFMGMATSPFVLELDAKALRFLTCCFKWQLQRKDQNGRKTLKKQSMKP